MFKGLGLIMFRGVRVRVLAEVRHEVRLAVLVSQRALDYWKELLDPKTGLPNRMLLSYLAKP